jgi:Acetyltransferase (GNAT) domain
VLAARRSRMWIMVSATRPRLASDLDAKQYFEQALSSSSRKKLRQHRNRLGKQGRLAHAIARDPASIAGELEKFLQLEAKGWKGRNGTALLCNPRDAAFARAAVPALAREGCVSMHTLSLDARPLSMQIIHCGSTSRSGCRLCRLVRLRPGQFHGRVDRKPMHREFVVRCSCRRFTANRNSRSHSDALSRASGYCQGALCPDPASMAPLNDAGRWPKSPFVFG